jgi:hypothetical protein
MGTHTNGLNLKQSTKTPTRLVAIEPRPYGATFRLRFNKTTRDALQTAVSDDEAFPAIAKKMAPLLSRMWRAAAATQF